MTHDEPYSPAEALGQALTRAEAAEADNRQLGIEIVYLSNRCIQLAAQLRHLQDENALLTAEVLKSRDAREAQAG